jgi:hypothetical protein
METRKDMPEQKGEWMPTLDSYPGKNTLTLDSHVLLMVGFGTLLLKVSGLYHEEQLLKKSVASSLNTMTMLLGWMLVLLSVGFKRRDDLKKLGFGDKASFNPIAFSSALCCALSVLFLQHSMNKGKNLFTPSMITRFTLLLTALAIPIRKRVFEVRVSDEKTTCDYRQWTDDEYVVAANRNGTAVLWTQTPEDGFTGYARDCKFGEVVPFREKYVYDWTCFGLTTAGALLLFFAIPSDNLPASRSISRIMMMMLGCVLMVLGVAKSS